MIDIDNKNTEERVEISKARRYMIFNLSIFDSLTKDERELYEKYQNCKRTDEKQEYKKALLEMVKGFSGIRRIESKTIYNKSGEPRINKLIASFENECVRLSKALVYKEDDPKFIPLIKEIVILDCPGVPGKTERSWHELILEQMINEGIIINEKKYIVYSASANQMKKRQVCLMLEQFYEDNKDRLMCGLTLDAINKSKENGCNTGKFLAYTSLIFSKSVESPVDIDINEVLVLPEFETYVTEKVNYLDMETLTVKEKTMPVPVNHMDGAGIFVPGLLPQSCQIRGGWIKGAIFPFDFRKFIIEKQELGQIRHDAVVKDVWGKEYSLDYIRDKIKIILNGSQLKMWKYYRSWEEYKQKFEENKLKICINNTMHYPESTDPIVSSAYQFYQTIPRENMTDERIHRLTELSIEKINDAKVNSDTALEIMGVDIENEEELDPFYASIKAYPQMLQDNYVRKRIDKKIQSERKKAMSGRPYIRGYYNYICPDLYAACEYWFCGIKEPEGLIERNHVYNALYADKDDITEVCCLRSPHLSDCEHGIRILDKSDACKEWFCGLDTVISTHDLLTKTLQCDVDGDEMLLTPDRAFIDLLDRNKLPLYYEMKKAEATEVNKKNIFECLMRSFKNVSIGDISNTLTKYLNMAYHIDYDFVRILTAYNNFCIDYPKSQYMPSLGQYENLYQEWTEMEYPYFFKYAKDKKSDKCCDNKKINQRSNVNRISKFIQQQTKSNKGNIWRDSFDGEEFKPQYFLNGDSKINRQSETYKLLIDKLIDLKSHDNDNFRERLKNKFNASNNDKKLGYDIFYFYCNSEILKIVKDNYKVTERIGYRRKAALYLCDIEYFREENENSNKDILWNCYGDILYENLMYNLKQKPEKIPKIRRNAYHNKKELKEEIKSLVKEVEEELLNENKITIMDYEYTWISELSCKKGSEHDRYLLYLLLVMYKRKLKYLDGVEDPKSISDDARKYFKIYKNVRDGKRVTRNTLDQWLEGTIAKRGLERLETKGLIKIESCKKYDKVYLKLPEPVTESNELFSVVNRNPMIDYYLYTGEAIIKKCVVCHRSFVARGGNVKTCSPECSRRNELINKN